MLCRHSVGDYILMLACIYLPGFLIRTSLRRDPIENNECLILLSRFRYGDSQLSQHLAAPLDFNGEIFLPFFNRPFINSLNELKKLSFPVSSEDHELVRSLWCQHKNNSYQNEQKNLEGLSVLQACPKARNWGIRRGMKERTARKKCPGAVFRLFELSEFWGLNESFLQLLESFSPKVEMSSLGIAYLELCKYSKPEELWQHTCRIQKSIEVCFKMPVRIGIAENKLIARLAVQYQPQANTEKYVFRFNNGICVVTPENSKQFIKDFSISQLPLEASIHKRLRMLGLNKLSQLHKISKSKLVQQFGEQGRLLKLFSNGEDERPIHLANRVHILASHQSMEYGLTGTLQLIDAIQETLKPLLQDLRDSHYKFYHLFIRLFPEQSKALQLTLNFSEAIDHYHQIERLLKLRLFSKKITRPVQKFEVLISNLVQDFSRQPTLVKTIPGSKRRFGNHLNLWLEFMSLRGLPMYKTLPVQPDSILPERRYALGSYLDHKSTIPKSLPSKKYKPKHESQPSKKYNQLKPLLKPKPIKLQVNNFGEPVSLIFKGRQRQVYSLLKQWHLKSFWWEPQTIDRQYYRLLLQDGFEIDVFQDLNDQRWYQQRFH